MDTHGTLPGNGDPVPGNFFAYAAKIRPTGTLTGRPGSRSAVLVLDNFVT
jgi:hypothetical protein